MGEVTILGDYVRNNKNNCKPLSLRAEVTGDGYETSEDEMDPDTLPDLITDAMQDLSLGDTHLTRFHGKSSSKSWLSSPRITPGLIPF